MGHPCSPKQTPPDERPSRFRKMVRPSRLFRPSRIHDLAADKWTRVFSGADMQGLVRCAGSLALSRAHQDGSGVDTVFSSPWKMWSKSSGGSEAMNLLAERVNSSSPGQRHDPIPAAPRIHLSSSCAVAVGVNLLTKIQYNRIHKRGVIANGNSSQLEEDAADLDIRDCFFIGAGWSLGFMQDNFLNARLNNDFSIITARKAGQIHSTSFHVIAAFVQNRIGNRLADVWIFGMQPVFGIVRRVPRKNVIRTTQRETIVSQTNNTVMGIYNTSTRGRIRIFRSLRAQMRYGQEVVIPRKVSLTFRSDDHGSSLVFSNGST